MNHDLQHFRFFRIVFGAYLTIHFAMLLPYGVELFSDCGILADAAVGPFAAAMPWLASLLRAMDAPGIVMGMLVLMTLASAIFMAGYWRKSAALILWGGMTWLHLRNPLIANPGMPYVILLLVLTLLVPCESKQHREQWTVSPWINRSAWFLMVLGYTFSGLTKLPSPAWLHGDAMRCLLENPLARSTWIQELFLQMPDVLMRVASYSVLLAEILFLPLCGNRVTRKWIWLFFTLMHVGLLVLVDFADLTWGMLVLHLFTMPQEWRPYLSSLKKRIV